MEYRRIYGNFTHANKKESSTLERKRPSVFHSTRGYRIDRPCKSDVEKHAHDATVNMRRSPTCRPSYGILVAD